MSTRHLVAFVLAASMLGIGAAGPAAGMRLDRAPEPTPAALDALLGDLAAKPPIEKLGGQLAQIARVGEARQREWVLIQSTRPLELDAFSDRVHAFTWPAGEQVAVAEIAAADLLRVAALPGVYAIDGGPTDPAIRPPDIEAPAPQPYAELRARLDSAPDWTPPAEAAAPGQAPAGLAPDRASDPVTPDGWYDARSGHSAAEAWDLGFRGEGVTVAVLDDPVDFGHPDLQGTWKVLPADHPNGGWPQAFDPWAGYLASQDQTIEDPMARSTRMAANGWIEMYQSSEVTSQEIEGETVTTACFQPLVYIVQGAAAVPTRVAEDCGYRVPATSLGGTIRFGHHPDTVLRTLRQPEGSTGEAPGVILVDEAVAGIYDTVYVDVDNDHDFSDEKPMNQASPLGWRDIDGDGVTDLTAGLLHFIADGERPVPGSWVWGLEDWIPGEGELIAIHWAYGGHGTLCASNIVGQGVLGVPEGYDLRFRDLEGGQPVSTNRGMAPDAGLVSIGSVYAGGRAMFAAAWRYASFGHELDRTDDDIQVTSNSYGFSDGDDDGWDADSRLIDYYVQHYAPDQSLMFSTGNGAPGYGTIAPPSPSVGIGVAASTQIGSTGQDSITDTMQITYGDIVPFSNRGPGADGRNGPTIAADGAYGAGATPINAVTASGGNGTLTNGTWGGTSRSSPVATGVMALTYQAFRSRHDRWPTNAEARAILMAGARHAGYDTFTMGAGVVDAADSVRIAAGLHGVFAEPSEWTAGGYRGARYEAFAKVIEPGASDTGSFTLHNPSDAPVDVTLSAQVMRRTGSQDIPVTTDRLVESAGGPVPDYLIPIDREGIPEGTELMVLRGVMPLREFDINGDNVADNAFDVGVMQHTDINGDGKLWVDANGNGAVNSRVLSPAGLELRWDDQVRDHNATPGGINAVIPEAGFEAEIAWYGLGCNDQDGNPPPPAQEITEKIALIERGTCTFVEKLTNAQAAGAIGAVVFTDDRAVVTMGGDGFVDIPAVMIDRPAGLELQAALLTGTSATARMYLREIEPKGLDGSAPVQYAYSEIQRWEYARFSDDGPAQNSWQASVHHPLERWSDGLYAALWHSGRSTAITNTHLTLRLDYYAYEDNADTELSTETLSIPAGGEASFDLTLNVPADAPAGAYQGAIFADYARGEGDLPAAAPGGYELPQQRVVIPINANVASSYDWSGSVTLGGEAAEDMDAPYSNGLFRGHFRWNWRPESGDWRFFFVDAASEPDPGTYWLFRTTWDDPQDRQSDIDTRVYGPTDSRFSDPNARENADEDMSDPDWYGPYTLGLKARSPYLVAGSTWPFNTSSNGNEDWLAAPAGEGLHEVMLHNVLFSGSAIEMPFMTEVSSLNISSMTVELFGDACSEVTITSQIDMPGLQVQGFGMSVPEVMEDVPVGQDDPNSPASAAFKHDVTLGTQAGRFIVTVDGEDDDDLDLFVMYDANGDGSFDYPAEQVGSSTSATGDERVQLGGFPPAGDYQIWVLGWAVNGDTSSFDMTVDTISGDAVGVEDAPDGLTAGVPAKIRVCADTTNLEGEDGPASGVLVMGPSGAPSLLQLSVTWLREAPVYRLQLPLLLQGHDLRTVEEGG
ncbi:MAG: S8 family serine peptidase [Chloroflexi bacterium]|nr:S8 family serine peptidase [Chloroflexota bacterium]